MHCSAVHPIMTSPPHSPAVHVYVCTCVVWFVTCVEDPYMCHLSAVHPLNDPLGPAMPLHGMYLYATCTVCFIHRGLHAFTLSGEQCIVWQPVLPPCSLSVGRAVSLLRCCCCNLGSAGDMLQPLLLPCSWGRRWRLLNLCPCMCLLPAVLPSSRCWAAMCCRRVNATASGPAV